MGRSPICPWLRGLPAKAVLTRTETAAGDACFVRLSAEICQRAVQLRPVGLQRYVALCRRNAYWLRPVFGGPGDALPSDAVLVLWQRDGDYGLLLPLLGARQRTTLRGSGEAFELHVDGHDGKAEESGDALLLTARGGDPLALLDAAFSAAARVLQTFRPRQEKPIPAMADLLGWCTWDAFYRHVSAEKVRAGLESWREAGLVPPLLLLDDGWQQTHEDKLSSFAANSTTFPAGLAELTRTAREDYGVRCVAAWVALTGYWCGIDPASGLGARYRLSHHRVAGALPWEPTTERDVSIVHPSDAHRFFDDWFEALRRQGVQAVKVDNQAALWQLAGPPLERANACRATQRAVQAAAALCFGGNQLSCMGQSIDAGGQALGPQLVRNSEDYHPERKDGQQRHVLENAYNALWTSAFGLPDWDMFQSHGEAAGFHAAARAICGGPIYLSDRPGEQDMVVVRSLCTSDGKTLRCDDAARPTADCLFEDCGRERKLLKLANRARGLGVLGLFHCREGVDAQDRDSIEDRFRVSDLPGLDGRLFAVYLRNRGELRLLDRRHVWRLELPWRGFEIATLAPVESDVAALGLLDKLVGAAALQSYGWRDAHTYVTELADGGQVGFYCGRAPVAITVGGREQPLSTPDARGLLALDAPRGGPVKVRLTFS